MFDLSSIEINPTTATEGKWVEYMGGKFLVARWNNRKAEALRNELQIEFYSELAKGKEEKMPENLVSRFDAISARIMSETILLDWDGVGHKDVLIPFSTETAYEFLSNPAFVDLFHFVRDQSISRDNFLASNEVEITKDVKTSADS